MNSLSFTLSFLDRRLPILGFFAMYVSLAPLLIQAQVRFEAVKVADGESPIWSTQSMNIEGQVIGEIYTEELHWQPTTAVWQRDESTRYYYQSPSHSPKVINDSGTIAGEHGIVRFVHELNPESSEIYLWNEETGYEYVSTNQFHNEGELPQALPTAISNTGIAVGKSTTIDDSYIQVTKGWIWSETQGLAQIPRLDAGLGNEITSPTGVNDEGIVVGHYGYGFIEGGHFAIGGFIYDATDGITGLKDIDYDFFGSYQVEPIGINNRNQIIGAISYDYAFVYDLETRAGTSFSGFDLGSLRLATAKLNSINNLGIAVGVAGDWERATTDEGREVPFLWSLEYGKTRLTDYTTVPLQSFLPEGQDIEFASFEVFTVNDRGQVLLSMYYYEHESVRNGFSLVLYPILDYPIEFKGKTVSPAGDLLVFVHSTKTAAGTLLPEQIGMTIVHEYSIDGKSWQQLEHGKDGVEIISQEGETQFRIPERPMIFVRSHLVANTGEH